eukprot:comp21909_c0_seq1/m.31457 comp21909_c0_seq1/g.31457  ORF comp21909_c0_seq1/g.31457 comp21909_c0_seq1/m.31457 type:complete len:265 (-) comp21909_c0_seq1:326-1120(-)
MSAKVSADILKEAFQKYDTDSSGTIDTAELRLLFQDLGWSVDDGAFKQALRLLDSDNSGTIEWGEFRKWSDFAWSYKILKTKTSATDELTVTQKLESLEEAPEHEHEEDSKQTEILRAAFDKYDTDKSGTIESNELSKIFADLRWPFTEESIQQAMDFLDSDHSGTIDWEEFANWSKFAWNYQVLGRQRRASHRASFQQKLDTSTIMEEEEVSSKSDVQVVQPKLARKQTEHDVQVMVTGASKEFSSDNIVDGADIVAKLLLTE